MATADREHQLDRAFAAYRSAVSAPDGSANFSADVWAAIEARRTSRLFGLVAKLVTSGALAASLLLGVLSMTPQPGPEPEYLATYLDQPAPAGEQVEFPYAVLEAEPTQ